MHRVFALGRMELTVTAAIIRRDVLHKEEVL